MKNNKNTGSYYTPEFLSRFIFGYVAPYFLNKRDISILEPSVGDGSFVQAFNDVVFGVSSNIRFTGVEKIAGELKKAELRGLTNRKTNAAYEFINEDFLTYKPKDGQTFSFIGGNPPYIKKNLLSSEDIDRCKEIHQQANLSKASIKNIWSAFLLKCSFLLAEDGVLSLILPAELLQVSYAAELREFLVNSFERTEIFTFDDLLFECKGQDTVLFIGYKKSTEKGQFFASIADTKQLEQGNFELKENSALVSTKTKWTHHFLTADELSFINGLKTRLQTIEHYCDSKPGIVSAANEYFIVDERTEKSFHLAKYCRPILQKALFVNGSVEFTKKDYKKLVLQGKPSKILCFSDSDDQASYAQPVAEYLAIGKDQKFATGYKCKKRTNWHVIPNISTVPEAFFFKRSHFYPKLINNAAKILVTDSAYKVNARGNFKIENIIHSFYNSLTLAVAELTGRYYGGGVLELPPQEFKKLSIPYIEPEQFNFKKFVTFFENKDSIIDVLRKNDELILKNALGLDPIQIDKISAIYQKLINKRFRNNKEVDDKDSSIYREVNAI